MEIEKVFNHVYDTKSWGDGVSVPLSGGGSDPDVARPYVNFVRQAISDFGIRSVVDIGHGDWTMWRDYRFPNISYFGIDVVSSLSTKNTELFGSEHIKFVSGNVMEIELPNADMAISKEVLQHLSNDNVMQILKKLDKYQFLILSNAMHVNSISARLRFIPARIAARSRIRAMRERQNPFFLVRRKNNIDVQDGGWRALDLEQEPFQSLLSEWTLLRKVIYPGSNYKGVNQAIYLYRR